jgi:hypothetical protein
VGFEPTVLAFEVGEVRSGKVKLEEAVVPCGAEAGLTALLVLINDQKFTKTAKCWGVDNNANGTNTNRIVVFKRAPQVEVGRRPRAYPCRRSFPSSFLACNTAAAPAPGLRVPTVFRSGPGRSYQGIITAR